jgi:hypothetical protein
MSIALIFMCTDIPNEKWLERIIALDAYQYTKIVVTDLEEQPIPSELVQKFSAIQFFQIPREEVLKAGYWDFAFADRKNLKNVAKLHICTWDKALYLHKKLQWKFSYLWFIEYDVMVPKRDTLSFLDYIFPQGDLLSASHISYEQDPRYPWWQHALVSPPLYHSMVSACRVSSKLLDLVHDFVQDYRKLFYLEIMFNTLAHQANLRIITPMQMKKIVFSKEYKDTDVNPYELVHPVKDFSQQERIWNIYNNE